MEGLPSASAERVARLRAAHQLIDDPRVFDDPLAVRILGAGAAALVSDEREDRSPLARSLRAFLAVRSRVAEDEVAAAYERGIRQYVVLGAGLDTFGYRNPFPGLQTVEVDHPNTQSSDLGFHAVTDWGPEELNATYFGNRADGLRVGSLGHVVVACA